MLIVFQRLFIEALLHVLLLPFWWYTIGLARFAKKVFSWFRLGNEYLVPLLWWGHLFVPMFGAVQWQERVISFFMRLVNALIRTSVLAVWAVVLLFVLSVWCLLPLVVAYLMASAFVFPKSAV